MADPSATDAARGAALRARLATDIAALRPGVGHRLASNLLAREIMYEPNSQSLRSRSLDVRVITGKYAASTASRACAEGRPA
jgi:hypothetical protein